MSRRCTCGRDTSGDDYVGDAAKPVQQVRCRGCDLMLYFRAPSTVSHDNPACHLFMTTCSHRLWEQHIGGESR